MRPPKRVEHLLSLLQRLWEKDSDLRFLQLIYVLQARFSEQNAGAGKVKERNEDGASRIGFDLFNTEDTKFIEFLEEELRMREQKDEPELSG